MGKKSAHPPIILCNSLPEVLVYMKRHSAVLTERSKMSQESDFLSSQCETGRVKIHKASLFSPEISSPQRYISSEGFVIFL